MSNLKRSIDSRVDYSLIWPVLFLLLIGVLSVYIAVSHDYPEKVSSVVGQQIVWILVGGAISLIVMLFNTKFLWQSTPYLYILGLVLMVLPLFFYNASLVASTGSKNWITFGNITLFQPSEFMKISYILMLSQTVVQFLKRHCHCERTIRLDLFLIWELAIYTLPVLILLAFQSDLGTALVFLAIFLGILLLSGISWAIIVPVFLFFLFIGLGFLLIFVSDGGREFLRSMGMPMYQVNRILAWLNPFDYAQTTTYQQAQGQIAIGSGGVWGKGFNVSSLLVPVRESDMIFTVIAEDFGFVGSSIVVILYLLLIYRMLKITLDSNNQFYTYISTGFIMMILFHVFENIGAVTGILPLTGIPLPFISQGGSSIISNLIGVGLLLSMSYQNSVNEEKMGGYPRKRRRVVLRKLR